MKSEKATPEKKLSWKESLTLRYIETLIVKRVSISDELYILNEEELKTIRNVIFRTLLLAALFGMLGVLLLYFPPVIWPELFKANSLTVPFINKQLELPLLLIFYGVILAFAEIYALTWINVVAVKKISYVCGFPNTTDPNHFDYINSLVDVGLERTNKDLLKFGINPLQDIKKYSLVLYLIVAKTKAALSNFFLKFLIKRFLGRFAIKAVLDLAGIPIYSFWNAFASYHVIKETKIRIMAPPIIRHLSNQMIQHLEPTSDLKELIYDTLQFVALSKRKYHYNHYLLAKVFLDAFEIPIEELHLIKGDFIEKIRTQPIERKRWLIKLLLLGFIIDGELTSKERNSINNLNEAGIFPFDYETVQLWSKSFNSGQGLNDLFNYSWQD